MCLLNIIIVNWNSGSLLRDCIKSIQETRYSSTLLGKIIVVDNNSSDESIKFLDNSLKNKSSYEIVLVQNNINNGFAKACNQGAEYSNSKYLLFLNPDTKLFEDSLDYVFEFIKKPPKKFGVLGVQLLNEKGQIEKTCRYLPTKRRRLAKITGLSKIKPDWGTEMLAWDHNETREVDQLMGAFFLVKTSVFQKLSGFDECFFVYFEEVDFCKRALDSGFKNMYLANSKIYHKGGGTSDQVKDLRLFYSLRSWLLYEKKHNGLFAAWIAFIIEMLEYISRLLILLFNNRIREIGQLNNAYKLLFKNFNNIMNTKTI